MKRNLKEGIVSAVVAGAITLVLGLAVYQIATAVSVLNTSNTLNSTASTTVKYIPVGTATTTVAFDTNGVDSVDLNIQFTASTTAAVLNWYYEFSDDYIDWFGEDYASVTGVTTVSHSASTLAHSWTPANSTASTTRKNIGINPIGSRYMRVVFSTTGDNGAVWARFALKKDKSN